MMWVSIRHRGATRLDKRRGADWWGLSMSSLEVAFTGYLFTLVFIAILVSVVMPRAPSHRISTAAREERARHTPPTDEEENLGTSRFQIGRAHV